MKLTINGKNETIEDVMTIMQLLSKKQLNPDTIVIEYNQEIIPKEKLNYISLKENDNLEIVSFVGGG